MTDADLPGDESARRDPRADPRDPSASIPLAVPGSQDHRARQRAQLRRVVRRLGLALLTTTILALAWALFDGWNSRVRARTKLAVRVEYPGRSGHAEWIYGPFAGADASLRGHDTAIWIDPALVASDGPLRSLYAALAQLEDRDLETGLGINPRGLGRAVLGRGATGGSSLHDQTCDALEDGFAPNLVERVLPGRVERLIDKLDNTLCGIGLARQASPEEVVALYASYAYLGSGAYGIDAFARIYWRFDGVEDPRLTLGHQLVLAALFNKPWTGDDARWPSIERRAAHALTLLIDSGQLDADQRRAITRQIARARPMTKAELGRRGLSRRLPRAPASMAYPIYRATREAAQRWGPQWRTKVAELDLTVDLARQRRALAVAKLDGALLDQGARVTFAVVDDRGEYQILHTGGPSFDESDRIGARRSPGSVTKLLIAAALARRYGDADEGRSNPDLVAVQTALRRSNSSYFPLANALDLDAAYVSALIDCYGDSHGGARDNVIEDAATGALEASPVQLLPLIQDARFGAARAMADPHVVRRFVLRDGEAEVVSTSPSEARRRCAELVHNDGATYSWFEIPMRGTMIAARRSVEAGKTGSVGRSAEGSDSANYDVNYWTLAIGGTPRPGRSMVSSAYETGIVVIGADAFAASDGRDLSIVGLEQSSRSAVPMLSRLLAR